MIPGRASRTALRVARSRAAHQLIDRPLVFEDPLAVPILGPAAATELTASNLRDERGPMRRALRAFVAARSRLAEDTLHAAVARGVDQHVVLGAGLDTFGYRNPYPVGVLRVFEVDHPATQAWKKGQLAEAGIAIPDSLTFAPVDFERGSLLEGLRAAGFRAGAPATFSWLGVTPYLTRHSAEETLRFIAENGPGSEVVFDYARERASMDLVRRLIYDLVARRVASVGEPFRSGYTPEVIHAELHRIGFSDIEDLGDAEINLRYFAGRSDRLKVGSLARLVRARVGEFGPGS